MSFLLRQKERRLDGLKKKKKEKRREGGLFFFFFVLVLNSFFFTLFHRHLSLSLFVVFFGPFSKILQKSSSKSFKMEQIVGNEMKGMTLCNNKKK